MSDLLLRRMRDRESTENLTDDYDVVGDNGEVVGRIVKSNTPTERGAWMWTLASGPHSHRTPTHGYEPTRETAMQALAKSWYRET